jgi:hypothetical protein
MAISLNTISVQDLAKETPCHFFGHAERWFNISQMMI